MKTILTLTTLALMLALAPNAAADPGDPVCLEDLPDMIQPCVPTDLCDMIVGCDPDDPAWLVDWVRDQLGPCTCDPIE